MQRGVFTLIGIVGAVTCLAQASENRQTRPAKARNSSLSARLPALPTGAVILWTGETCPAGFTRLLALDGKFLVSGPTYDPAGGGNNAATAAGTVSTEAHTHKVLASQPIWGLISGHGGGRYLITIAANENAGRAANDPPTSPTDSPASFAGDEHDNRPEFATILLCEKQTAAEDDLWTSNNDDVYNANAGNVGIGTQTPTTQLHVAGTVLAIADPLVDPLNIGVVGVSGNGIGILGATTGSGNAGVFIGNVIVTGALLKGGGGFRIDHPLDPGGKYLTQLKART